MPDAGTASFPRYGSIPRLRRDAVVTEKIDGTNGLVYIEYHRDPVGIGMPNISYSASTGSTYVRDGLDGVYLIRAGSRNRWLTRENDNFGFAAWVAEHAADLSRLGEGHHYGEWYGQGIQRSYGLTERRFALFNTARWSDSDFRPECCDVVPVLDTGTLSDSLIDRQLDALNAYGSVLVPGYDRPEGVVVYHTAARHLYKVLLDQDGLPKSLATGGPISIPPGESMEEWARRLSPEWYGPDQGPLAVPVSGGPGHRVPVPVAA